MEQVDRQELERRQRMLQDAYAFSPYIPDTLRQQLEETLDADQRDLVLQLQILAISFGRKLEARDRTNNVQMQVIHNSAQPSKLVAGMIASLDQPTPKADVRPIVRIGEDVKPTDPKDIMIVPGHALLRQ